MSAPSPRLSIHTYFYQDPTHEFLLALCENWGFINLLSLSRPGARAVTRIARAVFRRRGADVVDHLRRPSGGSRRTGNPSANCAPALSTWHCARARRRGRTGGGRPFSSAERAALVGHGRAAEGDGAGGGARERRAGGGALGAAVGHGAAVDARADGDARRERAPQGAAENGAVVHQEQGVGAQPRRRHLLNAPAAARAGARDGRRRRRRLQPNTQGLDPTAAPLV